MHDATRGSAARLTIVLLCLTLGVTACSGAASPDGETSGSAGTGAEAPAETPAPDAGGAPAAGGAPGETNVTGSLVSSGLYDATWTWEPGLEAGIGIGGTTLKSDKGTFGSIEVLPDGSISFSSGAPELTAVNYRGTGAQVHMKDASGTQLPCGWTLDNDVTGADGSVLHLKGTMDVIGTVFGCP